MEWLPDKDEAVLDSLRTPHLFPIPARVAVPMEEQEVRANRFVRQQEEPTENAKPRLSSKLLLRWLARVQREEQVRLRLR